MNSKNNTTFSSNRNIIKYTAKYFVLSILGVLIWDCAGKSSTERDTFANIFGAALFTGLFLGFVLILKSDIAKLITTDDQTTDNKTENKTNEQQ